MSAWAGSVVAPVAAGLATLCAATSLTSVVAGWAWFGYLLVAVVLIAATGLALRSLRAPTIVVGLSQLLVLLFLITGSFTSHGILKIIPGARALDELSQTLAASAEQIRTGLAPVDGTPPILCLVTIAIGLVAVLVDTLAVAAAAPAATGLVLLCVYAVPAALADDMLPWWTFVLGAAAFAGLLAVDGNHRHRRWRTREAPGAGGSASVLPIPIAVVSTAIVLGLLGGTVTWVGTVGKIPFGGNGAGGRGTSPGGFGVEPFTELRGLLDQGENTELFKVRGLNTDRQLLRAFTLDTYTPNKGWGLRNGGQAQQGVQANRTLPMAPGDDGSGPTRQIQIEPTGWVDNWLPIYGAPREQRGVADNWLYDRVTGAVFTTRKESAPTYTEAASLKQPTQDELRTVDVNPADLPPYYTQVDRVDPRVRAKTEQLTAGKSTNFDKATALWQFFTAQNGFVYDTRTADATDADALADFVLVGKRGFCEQFASAMAVMARVAGLPSRVAIGFTPGVRKGDYQSISSQDAHAWVEVYFGDRGWVSFDPTPLADGRGVVPPYLQQNGPTGGKTTDTQVAPSAPTSSAPATGTSRDPAKDQAQAPAEAPKPDDTDWEGILAAVFWALGVLVILAAVFFRKRLGTRLRGGPATSPADSRPGQGSEPTRDEGAVALATRPRTQAVGDERARMVLAWVPLVVAGLWTAGIAFLAAWASWWLGLIVLVLLAVLAGPAAVRDFQRRRRLSVVASHRPGAADAAWRELLAECADRGLPIPDSDTVRVAGQKLAQKHHLDEEGREGLRAVIGAVERSWYSGREDTDPELSRSFGEVRHSLRRNAPTSWRGKLFPKSLFTRRN
ncbi:DUF3488 and DUF4129 domain-containing transglutaminase family protein [Amycolatopsis sp. NPDC059020]|uniref:transglutaminase TgpA family protein n=1 Tax=Amycolatopsis sp. NPDC059020 TaxID=3346703 RepID=UPI00366E58DE